MNEELELIRQIITEIGDVGIEAIIAFIAYKISVSVMWLGFLVYVVHKAIAFFSWRRDKELDARETKSNLERDNEISRARNELNEVKSMYKILKEKYEAK